MKASPGAKIGLSLVALGVGVLGIGACYTLFGGAAPIPAPVKLPRPNGTDFYVAAARALKPANPPVDAIGDTLRRSSAEAARLYTPARRGAWIAANSKSWDLLARGLKLPARNATPRGFATGLSPDYSALRELARGQSIRVQDFKARGGWDAALSSGLDTFQMSRDIERGANLIGSLVGIAIEAIGERNLQEVPSHLSADEAKRGARRLEALIAGATPFSQVLSEEKWGFAAFMASGDWEKPGNRGAGFWGHLLMPRARVARAHAAMMDEFIAQADQPARRQHAVQQPAPWNYPVNTFYPPLARSFFNDHRRKTLENLLLVRLALRAYRVENGSYPLKLEALAPKYLAKIPTDAFGNGENLRFGKANDSYTLWSIGPDGIDNHGAPILNKSGRKPRFIVSESRGDVAVGP